MLCISHKSFAFNSLTFPRPQLQASKKTQKPKSTVKIGLRKYAKTSLSAIEKCAASPFYRADLKSAAKARYLRMYGDVRVKKGLAKKAITKHHRK